MVYQADSFGSCGSLGLLVSLFDSLKVSVYFNFRNSLQARSSHWSNRVFPSILWTNFWLLSGLPFFKECHCCLWGKVLIEPFIIHLHHRGINTSAEALNFLESKETIRACLAHSDSGKILDGIHALTCSSNHARSCSTKLEMIFSNLSSIKHGVE